MADMSSQGPSDPERLKRVLAGWLTERWPAAENIAIDDLSTPQATGYSNETVFFRASWREQGRSRDGRYVVRIEPVETPVYPPQTTVPMPSVDVQYRVMQAVAEHSDVPLAPLLGYETDHKVRRSGIK